jgi:putative effector of murein hydrolase
MIGFHPWNSLRVFLPASSLFALTLTLAAWLIGVWIQRRLRGLPLANPVLIAIVLIGAVLRLTHTSYSTYFQGAQFIHFLLGPATVALAIPLVRNIHQIRRSLPALGPALILGSLLSAVFGYLLVRLGGGTREVALSMLPKAATTPIAIGVARNIGGIPALTAVFAIAGGIIAAVSIETLLRFIRVDDWRAAGLAAGTAGSGIGAAEVLRRSEVAGAFAGMAIGLNGLLTSILCPLIAWLVRLL